jgi:P27 family predicted phage terminase small subunit
MRMQSTHRLAYEFARLIAQLAQVPLVGGEVTSRSGRANFLWLRRVALDTQSRCDLPAIITRTDQGRFPMPGPPPKAAARRQRARRDIGADITAPQRPGHPPAMPRGLCQQAQAAWQAYWGDVVSGVTRPSDTPLIQRWVKNLDRYHRLLAEADRKPVVDGSMGQPKANPVYTLILKIEQSIKEDEAQLGVGPLNRLRLGVALSESAKSLKDLNAEAETDAEDPRITLLADRRGQTP